MTSIFVILFAIMFLASAVLLALFQNAKDVDEEWEEAIRKKQTKK
jgi:preprotein translocase subunit SecG